MSGKLRRWGAVGTTLLALAGFAAVTIVDASAAGTTRYVATTGSDPSNDCTDPTHPCRTIQHAVDSADDFDIVSVGPGTYPEYVNITKNLDLEGAGKSATVITWPGNSVQPLLSLTGTHDQVRHLTVTHSLGGGILDHSPDTTLDDVSASYNLKYGLTVGGTATITNSNFDHNNDWTATGPMPGIGIDMEKSIATISNSTVIGNDQAGIVVYLSSVAFDYTLKVTDSTIGGPDDPVDTSIGQSATSYGGEGVVVLSNSGLGFPIRVYVDRSTITGAATASIANFGATVAVTNSTITHVVRGSDAYVCLPAGQAETLYNWPGGDGSCLPHETTLPDQGVLSASGSILDAGAGDPAVPGVDCVNTITDGGYNSSSDANNSCGFSAAAHDLIHTDPQLDPLADNGGPTPTMLPKPNSPVLDQIPLGSAGCAAGGTDQRGFPIPEPANGLCDIGAVEAKGTPTVTTAVAATTAHAGDTSSDAITIAGLGASNPASLAWVLLGPVAATAGGCPGAGGAAWAGATVVDTGTVAVSGDGSYSTGTTKPLPSPGCYTFIASLSATAGTGATTTQPGVPAETVLVSPNTPTVSTAASATSGSPGLTVHDTITLAGLRGATPTVTWQLLGPIDPVAGACPTAASAWSSAAVVDSGTVATTGDGTYQTSASTLASKGCYSYRVTVPATGTTTSAQSDAGTPAETVQVSPNAPTITTAISATSGHPGVAVHDAVTVAGLQGQAATVSWRLLHADAVNGACTGVDWTNATQISSGTIDFTGDGTENTVSTTLDSIGCYSYVASLPATPTTSAVTTVAGAPDETVQITKFQPTIDTTISSTTGQPGQVVHDSITVGSTGGAAVQVSWQLLGIASTSLTGCANLDWSHASVTASGTLPINGDSSVTTPDATLAQAGCYTYVVSVPSSPTTAPAATSPGTAAETAFVTPYSPTVTTTASSRSAAPGDPVHDVITVTGLHGAATTVAWTLLGPVPAGGTSCSTATWDHAAALATDTIAVPADGTYRTPDVVLHAAGCYTFVEQLAATGTTSVVTTDPGVPVETVLVQAPAGGSSTPPSSGGSSGAGSSSAPSGGTGSSSQYVGGVGVSSSASAASGTASTGAPVQQLTVLGLLALGAGAIVAWLARRRPRHS